MAQRHKRGGNGSRVQPTASQDAERNKGEAQGESKEMTQPRSDTGRHPLMRLREEVGSLFDRFFGSWSMPWEWGLGSDRFWGLDVQDEDKDIVVRAEAPGFEAGDFDIQISDNTLSIRAEHKQESETKKGESRSFERRHASFQRLIPLPANVDPEKVDARFKNGILELRLTKTEGAQRRRIDVKS